MRLVWIQKKNGFLSNIFTSKPLTCVVGSWHINAKLFIFSLNGILKIIPKMVQKFEQKNEMNWKIIVEAPISWMLGPQSSLVSRMMSSKFELLIQQLHTAYIFFFSGIFKAKILKQIFSWLCSKSKNTILTCGMYVQPNYILTYVYIICNIFVGIILILYSYPTLYKNK